MTGRLVLLDVPIDVGIMELGGASTQIAFQPINPLSTMTISIHIAGMTYDLFTHSFLRFGSNTAFDETTRHLLARSSNTPYTDPDLTHPCLLKGTVSENERSFIYQGAPIEIGIDFHQL